MAKRTRSSQHIEYGDFQTPTWLAQQVCETLTRVGVSPATILEPTCGRGAFLDAALSAFPNAVSAVGIDINAEYVAAARDRLSAAHPTRTTHIRQDDFFTADWTRSIKELPDPLLLVGNPPWVTNSALGVLNGRNAPLKQNFQNYSGIEAVTGKSNFDISEWMLVQMLGWISNRNATLAMLCKTSVARKVIAHGWRQDLALGEAAFYQFDAAQAFDVAVDACLLVVRSRPLAVNRECTVFPSLSASLPGSTFGYRNRQLIADVALFERWQHLAGNSPGQWRSGVKHDCAGVFEMLYAQGSYRNRMGQLVDVETDLLFPMLKSSEVAAGQIESPTRVMLVPQRFIGDETQRVRLLYPKTWYYLIRNAALLDRRASRIYRGQPRFAVFGIGPYTFAPWKVVISGFYKRLVFQAVGPFEGKSIVFDDTCYFLPCRTKSHADLLCYLLNSEPAYRFLSSIVFWDAKRPITSGLLQRLDLIALAHELGVPENRINEILKYDQANIEQDGQQLVLFTETSDCAFTTTVSPL